MFICPMRYCFSIYSYYIYIRLHSSRRGENCCPDDCSGREALSVAVLFIETSRWKLQTTSFRGPDTSRSSQDGGGIVSGNVRSESVDLSRLFRGAELSGELFNSSTNCGLRPSRASRIEETMTLAETLSCLGRWFIMRANIDATHRFRARLRASRVAGYLNSFPARRVSRRNFSASASSIESAVTRLGSLMTDIFLARATIGEGSQYFV